MGFTEEELIKYADLSEKIKENTKRILGEFYTLLIDIAPSKKL